MFKNYAENGLAVFPCNKDKSPAIDGGFHSASNDISVLSSMFGKNNLVGLPMSIENGLIVVDLDVHKDGDIRTVDEIREDVENNFGALPDTFTVQTPSGGQHLYYKLPDDLEIELKRSIRFLGKQYPVDLCGVGGYVIAPDDTNYITIDCEISDLFNSELPNVPNWIIKRQRNKKTALVTEPGIKKEFKNDSEFIEDPEYIDIKSALEYIDGDDRDAWVRVGMALKDSRYDFGYYLWCEWSKTSDKYNEKDQLRVWKSFKPSEITVASIIFEAKSAGFISTYAGNEIETSDIKEIKGIKPGGNMSAKKKTR